MSAKEPRSKHETNLSGLADIRGLARILNQFDLSEVELEKNGQRIRLKRDRAQAPGGPPVSTFSPVLPPSALLPPARRSTEELAESVADGSTLITSPFVGTFYRAPSPEASQFVEMGQTVKKGHVLCIVEAMKLMNEIEAEMDCKVLEILVKNVEPVEYGQPLFKVFPLA
jgi:acetyl-CoA carboxylase biotin carboxyl carrier protein